MTHIQPIQRVLEPTGSLYTAGEEDNGVHFTNLFAADPFEVQLPTIAPSTRGLVFRFTRTVPAVFTIRPDAAESIDGEAVGKYVRLVTLGASVSLISSSNNNWSIFATYGQIIFGGP